MFPIKGIINIKTIVNHVIVLFETDINTDIKFSKYLNKFRSKNEMQ